MIDFSLPEELTAIGDSLLRFVDTEVLPLERAYANILSDERNAYDEAGRLVPEVQDLRRQVRTKSSAAGFYTMLGPAALGGSELGPIAAAYLYDLLASRYGPDRLLIHPVVVPSPFTNGLSPVLLTLPEHVRSRYLPAIASGEKTLCFALSEPDAGSDVQAIKTRAVHDGNSWILNGTKQWITNAPYADYAMVFAVTDPEAMARRRGGITGFFVDTGTPGFSVSSVIRLMGHPGGDTGVISLKDVRVPEDHLLGEVGGGFRVALAGINTGRVGIASTCVGLARWCLDQAVQYAKVRKTFGKPIADHQAIQLLLADSAIDVYAARNMLWNCAWRLEQELPARKEIAMVKAFCTEMLNRVADRCMQVHGAMGLSNELRLEAAYRFARTMRIPDGTGEIQRRTVARELLSEDGAG